MIMSVIDPPQGGTDPCNVSEHLLPAFHAGHHAAEALQAAVQADNQAHVDGERQGRRRNYPGKGCHKPAGDKPKSEKDKPKASDDKTESGKDNPTSGKNEPKYRTIKP